MTQCPKCSSTDIMAPLKPITPAGDNTFVTITESRTSGFQIRASETIELRLAVCGTCGYAEHYVENVARLWKYWQKGYR